MCGICGKMMFDRNATVSGSLVRAMASTIEHRGPDDDGYFVCGHVGLGFRRLSIIDLDTGHQPISNETGTVWVIFNGEIYNYKELRAQLSSKGHCFQTHTDTEVLVHLYEEFGTAMLSKLRGMFAFAIWDSNSQVLLLARDRVGIKPLYYCLTDDFISFGSEIKALLVDPEANANVAAGTVARFLSFYYVPGDATMFSNIFKVPPGCYLTVQDGRVRQQQYWDLTFSENDTANSDKESEQQLCDMLENTVRLHMIADVPVGCLLSGGLDSTALLSFAAEQAAEPISSFTVGFSEPGIVDERPYARLAARTYGTEHHEITISMKQFVDCLPKYIWHMEEPICEPPAIGLYYVAQLARKHVKVLMSGEGGDEAFAGYSNYRNLVWLEGFKKALGSLSPLVGRTLIKANSFMKSRVVAKYAPLLQLPLEQYYYSRTATPFTFFNGRWQEVFTEEFARLVGDGDPLAMVRACAPQHTFQNVLQSMLYVDTKTWLPDDLLVKADKMTMANSIELRVPFLDHVMLEYAAALPSSAKVRWMTTKYLAKKALSRRVPRAIVKRKKAGFPMPYEKWQRNGCKQWVRDVLLDRQTIARGYFRRSAVEKILDMEEEQQMLSKEVFSLLCLELWHREFVRSDGTNVSLYPHATLQTTACGFKDRFPFVKKALGR